MEHKHPIDKLFRKGLSDADIPFDERDWTALSRKMHPRKRWPLLIWMGSGIAAALVIAAILLFGGRDQTTDRQPPANTMQLPPAVGPHADPVMPRNTDPTLAIKQAPVLISPPKMKRSSIAPGAPPLSERSAPDLLTHVQTLRPISVLSTLSTLTSDAPREVSLPRGIPSSPRVSSTGNDQSLTIAAPPHRGWVLSVVTAPDLSGTSPFRGKLGGNVGFMATYRLTDRLSISGGVRYAKKLYQTEFANYRDPGYGSNSQPAPSFIDADCNVLDIPLMVNVDLIKRQRATWFASAGASSYFMLSETYDYRYPPHEYGYPKRLTVRNENRHILGVGNVAIGYRRNLNRGFSITVQPFVQVPLTGIGNGNLKLFSSGVAISADIDLTRRTKR